MTEQKYTIQELNHIIKQCIPELWDSAITPEDLADILPEKYSEQASEIVDELVKEGLILPASHHMTNLFYTPEAYVLHISDQDEIMPQDRATNSTTSVHKLLNGKISELKDNEYFIIEGFKLSYDAERGVVLEPANNSDILPDHTKLFEFLEKYNIKVDCLDLTGHNKEIEGEMGLVDFQPATEFVELQKNGFANIMKFLSEINNIKQTADVLFCAKDLINKEETANRITLLENVAPGDTVLKNGVVYTFFEQEDKLNCKAMPLNENYTALDTIYGIKTTPSEMSIGDEVLGQPDEDIDDIMEQDDEFDKHQENIISQISDTNSVESQSSLTDSDIGVETKKVSNSPFFGEGIGRIYTPLTNTATNQEYAKTLNGNERARITAEIKINNLYAEKNRLKVTDKHKISGILGFLRNLIYRPLRNLIYFIAKPLVKDIPLFSYNKSISNIKNEIKDVKDSYFNAEENNHRFIKKHNINIQEIEGDGKEYDVEQLLAEQEQEQGIPERESAPTHKDQEEFFDIENTEPAVEQTPESEGVKTPDNEEKTSEIPQPKKSEHKISYPKLFKQIVRKVAPPNTELSLTSRSRDVNGKKVYTNDVTFIRPAADGSKEEIKLSMDNNKELSCTTAADISKQTISDLSERVIVAQQIARGKTGLSGISEENWNRASGKRPSKADVAAELISGESKSKDFFVNGIKTTVEVLDNGNFSISALGGVSEVSQSSFVDNPCDTINTITYDMAINKYIGYTCEKLPEKLATSAYLDRVSDGRISFGSPQIDFCKSGRPIISIPAAIVPTEEGELQTIDISIKIDANNGEIQAILPKDIELSPHDLDLVSKTIDTTKGLYASNLLSTISPETIYSEPYAGRVMLDIQKVVNSLEPNTSDSVFVCGLKVDVSKEMSGTVKLHVEDTYGQHTTDFSCYDNTVPLTTAMQIQEIGRESMKQDRKLFAFKESKAATAQLSNETIDYTAMEEYNENDLMPTNQEITDDLLDKDTELGLE